LEYLVEAGLSPVEALQAATWNSAQFLDATDSLGSVQKEHVADLVLLDANPLDDIRNTRRISAVIAAGRLIDGAERERLLEEASRAAERIPLDAESLNDPERALRDEPLRNPVNKPDNIAQAVPA
jgi:adenine deaminase